MSDDPFVWNRNNQFNFEWYVDRYFSDESKAEIEAFRAYFNSGDAMEYIKTGQPVSGGIILYCSPLQHLDELLHQFKCYWDWVAEDPANHCRPQEKTRSLEDRFVSIFQELVRGGERFPLPLLEDLFFWAYGKTYDPNRPFPMTFGPNNWRPEFRIDVDFMCSELQVGLRKYLWSYDLWPRQQTIAPFYKTAMDYFLSIFPHMGRDLFGTKLYPNKYFENGRRVNKRGFQSMTRWLIAGLNNILTPYEKNENITELVIHDQAALDYLKAGLAKLDMPPEYYRLVEAVKTAGFDCLYMDYE